MSGTPLNNFHAYNQHLLLNTLNQSVLFTRIISHGLMNIFCLLVGGYCYLLRKD